MAVSHRTNRLKVIGNPSVEKLQNDRFRLTFNLRPLNARQDWYNANKSRIFADFGTLESAAMSVDGIDARVGEPYTNMRLTSVETGTSGGEYIVQFVYETLGDTFVQVKDDTIDTDLNGLRRVRRVSIAKAGTDFQKTVGSDSINHQIDTEAVKTLFLAQFEIDDTDSSRQVTEVYLEPGIIRRNTSERSGGASSTGNIRIQVVESFKDDPTSDISGAVNIGKNISNVNGFPTKVFTFAKGDGSIRTSERTGPSAMPGSRIITVESVGTAVEPSDVGTSKLIEEQDIQEDGYVRFVRSKLVNIPTGTTTTYTDVVDVRVPGQVVITTESVSASAGGIGSSISGTVAVTKVTPVQTKKVAATVTQSINTSPPSTSDLAFNLDNISCSVTSIRTSYNCGPGKTATAISGSTQSSLTGFVQSFSPSVSVQTYPGCFINGLTSVTGTVSYIGSSTPRANNNVITSDTSSSESVTKLIGTGSTDDSEYETTGIIRRRSRPVITALDGTTYYETVTWSV